MMTVAKPQADGIAGIVLTLSPVPRIVDTRESTVPNGYKSAYGVLEVEGEMRFNYVAGSNVGSRAYFLESENKYKLFKLANR